MVQAFVLLIQKAPLYTTLPVSLIGALHRSNDGFTLPNEKIPLMYMQKHFFFFLFCLGYAHGLFAQLCDGSVAVGELNANNILARINAGGALFAGSTFIPNPQPDGTGPSTMYGAALWIAGQTPAGELKLMAHTHRSTGYFPGPLNDAGFTDSLNCLDWDRVFKIDGADIPVFLGNLPAWNANPGLAIQQFPAIMGWPAKGNPFFSQVQGFDLPQGRNLAPFFDADGDASYNPLKGDYPVVELAGGTRFVPTQWIWSVHNGFGAPASSGKTLLWVQAEIHQTAWVFDCANQPRLTNTVFTAHRVIFRGASALESCYVGMWADFDIGCAQDDLLGSRPDLNAFFAYNSSPQDGANGFLCTDGNLPFGQNPPVQSVTFLGKSLDKFMYYNNPSTDNPPPYSTDPRLPLEFYYYLDGRWKDGLALSSGNTGYNPNSTTFVNHAFPGDPTDPNAWTMCATAQPSYDRRAIGSHYLGAVEPGRQEEFVFAWTAHPNSTLPCNLGTTFDDIAAIRGLYDKNFGGVCSPLTTTAGPHPDDAVVEVFPNPAGREITLRYGDRTPRDIRLLTPDGRLARHIAQPQPQQTLLHVGDLPEGVYLVQCRSGAQTLTRKIVILRE